MKQLILTCLPSFYKNLAFKELSELSEISIFYTNSSPIKRESDFFKHGLDDQKVIPHKRIHENLLSLLRAGRKADFVILGGWDDPYFWFMRMIMPKRKLKVIVESSIYELGSSSIFNYMKRFFLKGIAECIVSGDPHVRLVEELKFRGAIRKSLGVGVLDFDYDSISKIGTGTVLNFLYIGRISRDKGIDFISSFFKSRPDLRLNLVGNFENDDYINEVLVSDNIIHLGYKSRDELRAVFAENDVFILPSRREPWGLVIEEALYHGLPVIVSNMVGANENFVRQLGTGVVFEMDDSKDFTSKIDFMLELKNYNSFIEKIKVIDFNQKKNQYIRSFI
ncbi:glycosyltransferase family 4 protein [Pedobacter duraquae]|uniref:Glycosyl transferase family 1 n=1 Tax=Pedobacter duraquae TaxID=425511 RepID=A0A4R6IJ73_9SPHI|nr:glycosyltransferase family 4 protein [Pedobacter duraquae]TDO21976.1 glycosyl transferase family 1 [Pedobacter duraquae]